MKEILLVDVEILFRQFLKEKFLQENINVEAASSQRDAVPRLLSQIPNLIIIDYEEESKDLQDFLSRKQTNPNTVKIPIILIGPEEKREQAADFARFGVFKFFAKPIRIDFFFNSIAGVLETNISLDSTPCFLDIHICGTLIFIEIADGLNREKIALLRFRIEEIIENLSLSAPKIVVMLSNLKLNFVDGANLEHLFDNIICDPRIRNRNVKVLTFDAFTKDLIEGHAQYEGIEVANNILKVLNSLVDLTSTANPIEVLINKVLLSTHTIENYSVELNFSSENQAKTKREEIGALIKVAIVDDDALIGTKLRAAFSKTGGQCYVFFNGEDFLESLSKNEYDVIILDIYMPLMSGFDVLKTMNSRGILTPVIIYSHLKQKEMIVQALSLGAKSYILKQQSVEAVVQKAFEVKSNEE